MIRSAAKFQRMPTFSLAFDPIWLYNQFQFYFSYLDAIWNSCFTYRARCRWLQLPTFAKWDPFQPPTFVALLLSLSLSHSVKCCVFDWNARFLSLAFATIHRCQSNTNVNYGKWNGCVFHYTLCRKHNQLEMTWKTATALAQAVQQNYKQLFHLVRMPPKIVPLHNITLEMCKTSETQIEALD